MKNANPKILELIALFFISVDNDIYNWKIDTCLGHEIYKSKDYGDNAQFIIDTKKNELVLHSSYESILISKYCNIIFIKDKKISKYVSILRNHFKKLDENKKNKKINDILSNSTKVLKNEFHNEYNKFIRKEKLNVLNK